MNDKTGNFTISKEAVKIPIQLFFPSDSSRSSMLMTRYYISALIFNFSKTLEFIEATNFILDDARINEEE